MRLRFIIVLHLTYVWIRKKSASLMISFALEISSFHESKEDGINEMMRTSPTEETFLLRVMLMDDDVSLFIKICLKSRL